MKYYLLFIGILLGYLLARVSYVREKYTVPVDAPVGNNQISQEISMKPSPMFDDRNLQTTQTPQGASFIPEKIPHPQDQQYPSGCLLGCNSCSPLCSGEGNRCGIVAPVPSAVWQPQSASTVQYRLKSGNYVPSVCPQGRIVPQSAPGCQGTLDYNSDRKPYMTPCYTAQEL